MTVRITFLFQNHLLVRKHLLNRYKCTSELLIKLPFDEGNRHYHKTSHTNTDIKVLISSEYEGSLGGVVQLHTANDRQNESAFLLA